MLTQLSNYALGYDFAEGTWWKNPLSLDDLQFNSRYNAYAYVSLLPAPISNPSLDSLQAVAFLAETAYYFFRAKCDGSGYHNFLRRLRSALGMGVSKSRGSEFSHKHPLTVAH